ncbi:MAG TPA: TadE/TadG family type IV pilus assembly protein [Pirellulales bacterium]|jgi:Flp pilus assembly protein TadG|nr:TadE/TadG family type IV pilus assembly protein [Pirellulales bacterium]
MKNKLEKVRSSCRRIRRGAAAVEFALVAPIFILLVFGMIEYGRMVMVQQILTNAVREAARKSVLDGADAATIKSEMISYLNGANVSNVNTGMVTINPSDPNSAANGTPITVTVAVPYANVSWLPSSMFSSAKAKTLTATAVMRRESVQ